MSDNNYKPLFWGIIELFGHNVIAGEISEQTISGEGFIRVDVPEADGESGFTKLFGKGAIYAITPTDEDTARAAVEGLQRKPVEVWRLNLPQLQSRHSIPDEDEEP